MRPQDDDTPDPDAAARPPDASGAGAAHGASAGGAEADDGSDAHSDTMAGHRRGSELRITVARSGGVAGLGPRWTVTVSEEEDVDSWLSLVESCPWDAPDPADGTDASGTGSSGAGGADRFVYTIRVFLPSDEERDARVPEQRLDGPWRDLVDRVKDAGDPEPRARS